MSILENFHFLRPLWLLAIPLWSLLVWIFLRQKKQASNVWQYICAPELLAYLLKDNKTDGQASALRWHWLVYLGGFIALFALAGPAWEQLPQPVLKKQSARVVVLDLSHSMDATDLSPSRLVRAKHKVQDILSLDTEGQTGLVVFAGTAFDVIPLTSDRHAILAVLQTLSTDMMPVQGSRASSGIEHAAAMLQRGKITDGTVVLITDGVDKQAAMQAKKLRKAGHFLHVLGVGTPQGAPIPLHGNPASKGKVVSGFLQDSRGNIVIPRLDREALVAVASSGGGVYQNIRLDDRDIQSFFTRSTVQNPGIEDAKQVQTSQWREEGVWLVLVLLPCVVLAFRRGVIVTVFFGFISLSLLAGTPVVVQASEGWRSWFTTPDQQGSQAMQQQSYAEAAQYFKDPSWKATALYRAGKLAEAVEIWQGIDSADAQYNRGNALVRLGKLEAAVAAYDEALKRSPEHDDARFNRERVKAMLQQQKNEAQKANRNDTGKQDQENDAGNEQNGSEGGGGNVSHDNSRNDGKENQGQKQDATSEKYSDETADGAPSDAASGQESQSGKKEYNANASESLTEDAGEADRQKNGEEGRDVQTSKALEDYKRSLQDTSQQKKDMAAVQDSNKEKEEPEGKPSFESVVGVEKGFDPDKMEAMQAQQQWLRKIPDDPGGLMRRKFRYQYRQQEQNGTEIMEQTW